MIFRAGLIHCDMHPGNVWCDPQGRVAVLVLGFVAEMAPRQRREFARFFACIAFATGKAAAQTVRDAALRVRADHDERAFARDMQGLLDRTAGRRAGQFQVAAFVTELFEIQRRNGIYGSPAFTMAILSLLCYEGLIKGVDPDLDFQQAAIPFVLGLLGTFA
jgi:ubiquinone biosynthesis protein